MPKDIALQGNRMARELAGWKVLHTGGGMFVAVKDFQIQDGSGEAAVVIDGDAASAYRRPNGWIQTDEYLAELGHIEDADEVVLAYPEGDGFNYSKAESLLGREAALEVVKALMSEVWE